MKCKYCPKCAYQLADSPNLCECQFQNDLRIKTCQICKGLKEINDRICKCNSFQQEPRDYPEGKKDMWYEFPCTPKDESTILMKMWNRDVPPWTGYYNGEDFIAFETRLPIRVSHWKYVE